MKKVLFAIAIVMTMGFCANAQTDSWFNAGSSESYSNRDGEIALPAPGLPGHGESGDQPAPLGSGLLILTAMGAGYALRKRNA